MNELQNAVREHNGKNYKMIIRLRGEIIPFGAEREFLLEERETFWAPGLQFGIPWSDILEITWRKKVIWKEDKKEQ